MAAVASDKKRVLVVVDDHITVSLVQNIHSFLRNARSGHYENLWDVVTSDEF